MVKQSTVLTLLLNTVLIPTILSYPSKRWADKYVKLSGRGKSYDHISHPTYTRFTKTVSKYFTIKDITFDIVQNAKKYYLDKERGKSARIASGIITKLKSLKGSIVYKPALFILSNITHGVLLRLSGLKYL